MINPLDMDRAYAITILTLCAIGYIAGMVAQILS